MGFYLRMETKVENFLYWHIFKPIFKKLYRYVPIDMKKIVFSNFYGSGYGDSPRSVCEELLNTNGNYDVVWLVKNMDTYIPEGARKVKTGTFSELLELASAKVWVDNVRMHSVPKKDAQILLQTWHGPFSPKLLERGAEKTLPQYYLDAAKYDGQIINGIISNSRLLSDQYKKYFWLNDDAEILEIGLPRNDFLIKNKNNSDLIKEIRKKLGLTGDTFVILYAPTFRDDMGITAYQIDFDAVRMAFENRFKKDTVILFRLHPNIKHRSKEIAEFNDKLIDVSWYPDIQELSLASDCIISDYSTSPMDFAILDKIIFLCCLDIDEYKKNRGLMPEFDNFPFQISFSVEDLIKQIQNYDEKTTNLRIKQYFIENPIFDEGDASKKAVSWIVDKMNQ